MEEGAINLSIEPISNGFLVSATKGVGNYSTAETPRTFVATRRDIIAGLASLYEAAECLTNANAKEDF